jgi:hypothetical protein
MKEICNRSVSPKVLEIGVFRGEFLDYIVNNCSIYSIDGVDLFQGDSCSGDVDGNNVVHYNLAKSYHELTDKYKNSSIVKLIQSDSSSYLKTINNDYYDIIYIDGDHSYEGVKKDLSASFEKVKNGGYIMGHDYEMNMNKAKNVYEFGVKQAVDEFCRLYNQNITEKAIDGCVSYSIKINKNI